MAQKKASTQSIDLLDLEDRIHRLLSDDLEAEMEAGDLEGVPERDALIVRTRRVLEGESLILTKDQTEQLIRGVVDRIVGLGPLEPDYGQRCPECLHRTRGKDRAGGCDFSR